MALDGSYYVFVRYRDGHWYPEPALEVTPTSSARFLRSLFSLASGRALIPENLVEDFFKTAWLAIYLGTIEGGEYAY